MFNDGFFVLIAFFDKLRLRSAFFCSTFLEELLRSGTGDGAKVVDHLLVFHGDGKIQDFPGNYTQYRIWEKLQPKPENDKKPVASSEPAQKGSRRDGGENKRRMTYKEKQEFAQLEKDIDTLTKEKNDIETALSSGTLSVEQITEMSKRLPILTEELDEKELRWLELSELT